MKKWLLLSVIFIWGCEDHIEYIDVIEQVEIECNCVCDSFPTEGLVAWYPFNGNSLDESGNENHSIEDTSILSQDRNGDEDKSVYFSGVKNTNFIKVDINTESVSTYTISLWVYREGRGSIEPRVFEFWGNDGPGQLGFTWPNNNNPSIGNIYDNRTVSITELNLQSNNWHHVVYSVGNTSTKLYLDGVLIEEQETSGTPSLSGKVAFGMMNHPLWDSFNGKLDDIGIWDRVITQDEVTYLFEN